jgi:hypothetical protein
MNDYKDGTLKSVIMAFGVVICIIIAMVIYY